MAERRRRRLRSRRVHGVPDAAARRARAGARSPSSEPRTTRPRVWRRRAAAIRQREMRSESDGHCLPRPRSPGSPSARRVRRRSPAPLVASVLDRYHPTVEEFLVARRGAAGAERLGPEPPRERGSSASAAVDGGFELDGEGAFRTCCSRRGIPGLNVPGGAARRPARRPRVRAARVRVDRDRGRCRPRGRDRVAERARRGRRGRLGPAARAAAAAAERAARVLLAPRARRLPPARARRARRAAAGAARAVVSAGRGLGRAARAGGGRGALPRRALAERQRAGDLRDRLPARLPARPAARAARRRARARDGRRAGSCSRRTRSVPALTDETRTLALAGAPAQWAFPAADTLAGARYVAPRLPAEDQVVSYTLRGRIESRLAALAAGRRGGVRARRSRRTAGGRSRRLALMVGVGLALDAAGLPPRCCRYQPGWAAAAARRCSSSASCSALMRARSAIAAPLWQAVALFAGGWLARAAARSRRLPAAAARLRGGRRRARPSRRRLGARASALVLAGAGGDGLRAAAAGRPPCRRRPPGPARDHAARGARRRARARSSAAASSSGRTT